ncbi:unnamed protein product [Nesidiocoris tenuis]|uniref:Reverse transcriptase domain-containing protein n=1 Tax=Nesidiocoris tenuis TaxID=355587 RepID=A0A6H5H3P6_9HEMI|nr:unnamed protein product [Nesidiocoris tenuis]
MCWGYSWTSRGAFDNVWWPFIIDRLLARGCPPPLVGIVQSYLADRVVMMKEGDLSVRKGVTKGCPQGSVLGPQLWNMAFDELLEALESAGFPVIAYADDAVVLVEGGSRRALEEGGAGVAGILEAWSASSKLEFCKSKSEWMLLKGHLDPRRGPHIVWGGQTMRGTQRVKYLGVTLTSGLRLGDHVEDVCERAKRAFFKVARLSGSGWGLTGDDLLVIYRGVFLGILLYAVPAWWPVLSPRSILERKLGSAQRAVLLKVVRAYRTTSGGGRECAGWGAPGAIGGGSEACGLLHCQGAAVRGGRAHGRWGRSGRHDQD